MAWRVHTLRTNQFPESNPPRRISLRDGGATLHRIPQLRMERLADLCTCFLQGGTCLDARLTKDVGCVLHPQDIEIQHIAQAVTAMTWRWLRLASRVLRLLGFISSPNIVGTCGRPQERFSKEADRGRMHKSWRVHCSRSCTALPMANAAKPLCFATSMAAVP